MDEPTREEFLTKFGDANRRQLLKRQIELLPAIKLKVETLAGDVADTTFTNRDTVTFKFLIEKNPTHGVAFLHKYGYLHREKFYFTL
jgi:hypothetical protein